MQGLRSNSTHLWAPQKGGVKQPLLILSPLLGTPENVGATYQFHPFVAPQEGRGEATTSDFVPFVGYPRECRGYAQFRPLVGP